MNAALAAETTMHRRIALLLSLCLLLPARGAAQSILELRPGDTIRVGQPGLLAAQGILLHVSESAVSFQRRRGADTLTLALSSLSRFDVARGRQTNVRGMVQGGGLGILIGALGGAIWEFARAQQGVSLGERDVGIAAGVGGAAGLVVGGLAGAARPVTRWVPVRLPNPARPDTRAAIPRPPAPQTSMISPS